MKKRLVWLLAGLMVVSMLGCGSKENEGNTTEDVTQVEATTDEVVENEAEQLSVSEIDNIEEIVTLNEYKGITVSVNKTELTDEAIISYINNYLLSTFEVKGRAVQSGDIAVIDFTGYKDGVAFDGGSSTDFQLEIGSHSFIDGFEDGLIGVNPGETVDLNLTFPEDYASEDLAGQPAVFTVTVKSILGTTTYDELTEEQLALMGGEYTSKEALWAAAEEALKADYEESYKNDVTNAALEVILNESNFTNVPEYLVDQALDAYLEYSEMICNYYYQTDLETFVKTYYEMTIDEYKESAREQCENEVKQSLAIEAIGRAENLIPTEEEILKEAEEYVDIYGYESVDELFEVGGGKAEFVSFITQNRVLEYLQNNVTVEAVTE